MPVRELSSSTWKEIESLVAGAEPGRLVAILPVGATEAHGPHLPLATDVVISEAMAREGARRLSSRGFTLLVLPPLPYTAAPFAAGFPGTISIGAGTVRALLVDVARSLAAQGVSFLALANAHLDPSHVESLRSAVEEIRELAPGDDRGEGEGQGSPPVPVFPDLTRRRWAERLTEEFRSGACHAGRFEGSVVLAERPEWVRDAILSRLPPVPRSLVTAIREGRRSFEEAGGDEAYFGWPAEANAEEGRRTVEALGAILEEAVVQAFDAASGAGKAGAEDERA